MTPLAKSFAAFIVVASCGDDIVLGGERDAGSTGATGGRDDSATKDASAETAGDAGVTSQAGAAGTSGSAGAGTDGPAGAAGASGRGAGGDGGAGGDSVASPCDSAPSEGPSCAGLSADCGPTGDESCCAARCVPGAVFTLGRGECHTDDVACGTERACSIADGSDYTCLASETPAVTASVRTFFLDRFEVTVGRFRKFVEAVDTGWRPLSGDGTHGYLNGGTESGWEEGWMIPTTASAWDAALSCSSTWQAWTPRIGANETKPINCISWYDAFAFCIWDSGVLPSEAEWELAASGGEERVFPWGNDDPGTTRACYVQSCSGLASAVGAFPAGDGRWGHADLAGNVFEWVLDVSADYPSGSCNDCAFLSSGSHRILRGGHFRVGASFLRAAYRSGFQPWSASHYAGVRCARTVE